jgi:copper transport protein
LHGRATNSGMRGSLPLLLLVAMALLSALPSFGHATLLGSDPRSGVVLDTAPGQVVLTFSESARALAVHLIDASGKQTSLTDESLTAGERIIIKLPPGLPDGTQVLTWRAASSDGHPVAGSVVFSIGDTSQTPPLGRVRFRSNGADTFVAITRRHAGDAAVGCRQ